MAEALLPYIQELSTSVGLAGLLYSGFKYHSDQRDHKAERAEQTQIMRETLEVQRKTLALLEAQRTPTQVIPKG
jgi:hypothetical protein